MATGSITQKMPIVAVSGATSGSFTVTPYTTGTTLRTTSGNSGTVGVVEINAGSLVKHNHAKTANDLDSLPLIVGDATITITAPTTDLDGNAVTTKIHVTLNGKSPGPKAQLFNNQTSPVSESVTTINYSKLGGTIRYGSAFVLDANRGGSKLIGLRVRAYKQATQKINNTDVSGISPLDRSAVLIVRFLHQIA